MVWLRNSRQKPWSSAANNSDSPSRSITSVKFWRSYTQSSYLSDLRTECFKTRLSSATVSQSLRFAAALLKRRCIKRRDACKWVAKRCQCSSKATFSRRASWSTQVSSISTARIRMTWVCKRCWMSSSFQPTSSGSPSRPSSCLTQISHGS